MIAQSLRYWIADLISGGALTRAEASVAQSDRARDAARVHRNEWAGMYDSARAKAKADLNARDTMLQASATLALRYGGALRTIAAMETPNAAPAAKRMASVAREAVKP